MSTTLFKTTLTKGVNSTNATPVTNIAPVIVQGVEIGATYRERDTRGRESYKMHTQHSGIAVAVENGRVLFRRPNRTTTIRLDRFLTKYHKVFNANS